MVNETNIEEIEAKVARLEARIEAQRIELRRARNEGEWVSEVKTDGEVIVDLRCRIHELSIYLDDAQQERRELGFVEPLKIQIKNLEAKLQLRKGVRYPDHKPNNECVEIWTYWRNTCEKARYQWITRNRCTLVAGEYWRVRDYTAPDESKEGGA